MERVVRRPQRKLGEIVEANPLGVKVRDGDGEVYWFLNGSINQVAFGARQVGRKGWVEWARGASYSLPFFDVDDGG